MKKNYAYGTQSDTAYYSCGSKKDCDVPPIGFQTVCCYSNNCNGAEQIKIKLSNMLGFFLSIHFGYLLFAIN